MRYDREVLVDVLVHHWPTRTSGCECGWAKLGASYPGHIADVYEAAMTEAMTPEECMHDLAKRVWALTAEKERLEREFSELRKERALLIAALAERGAG